MPVPATEHDFIPYQQSSENKMIASWSMIHSPIKSHYKIIVFGQIVAVVKRFQDFLPSSGSDFDFEILFRLFQGLPAALNAYALALDRKSS